jgi:transketolase
MTELEWRDLATQGRERILRMIHIAGSGHPGGSLSAIDILTYLYFSEMRIDPTRPKWEDRDRFVLSKGHCAPSMYVTLMARGYFGEDLLWTLRDIESKLQGHPDMKGAPGIDMTTGSLGQGFSCAVGMALAARVRRNDFRVFAMLGDGELQEGVIWEAAMAAGHYKLDNLVAVIDNNRLQTDGWTKDVMNVEPVDERFRAFGFDVQRIDGHDFAQIDAAFLRARSREGKPHAIVADTVKGKGVASMENNHAWHAGLITKEQFEQFMSELQAGVAQ